jgi:hypothetical protein
MNSRKYIRFRHSFTALSSEWEHFGERAANTDTARQHASDNEDPVKQGSVDSVSVGCRLGDIVSAMPWSPSPSGEKFGVGALMAFRSTSL